MAELVRLPGVKGQFAAGLSWRHSDTKPTARELREVAHEEGRWGIVRTTTTDHYQIGTCDSVDGAKTAKGVRPLAAIVADHHQEPWMGLYPLDDNRYWYIAVRDGGEVIPDGDLIGSLDELMTVRNQHARLGAWHEINGTFDDLAEMVRATPVHRGLKDLQARPWVPVLFSVGVACALGGAFGAYMYVQNQHQAQLREAQMARARALAAARKATADAEARVLPWTREPMVRQSIDACRRAWSTQQLAAGGWELAGWLCEIGKQDVTIKTEWSRAGGVAAGAPGVLSSDPNKSTRIRQIAASFSAPSSLASADEDAMRALRTFGQVNDVDLKVTALTAPAPVQGASATAPNVWGANQVVMTTDAPLWKNGIGIELQALAGFRIKSVSWSGATQKWSADATLYSLHTPSTAAASGSAAASDKRRTQ